jgi:xanthine dehydrogenase YagT iron-sulfur-binding subunit
MADDSQDFRYQEELESAAASTGRRQDGTGARCDWPITRREFVAGTGAVIAASSLHVSPAEAATLVTSAQAVKKMPVSLTINGERKQLKIDPRASLLDLLREDLQLTGTKKGCDHGQCGACTVLVNGRRINSCLALAISHDGEQVTTIEGLAKHGHLDPVQQAFLDHDGYQCGYCTPGQIISVVALLEEAKRGAPSFVTADLRKPGPADLTFNEIRERMSGNICRCGAYPGIVAAVRQVHGANPEHASSFAAENEGGSSAAI